jgi:hypothetical protein
MGEKNILAYFKTPEAAEGAKKKLQALRPVDISIDRFSKYPGDGSDQVMNPLSGDVPSLGYLTLNADFSNKSAAIMAAADPSASGLSDGGQDEISGRDILLTAVVDEAVHEKALKIIKDAGGLV